MNQKKPVIFLRDFVESKFPFGNDQGRVAYQKLVTECDKFPEKTVVGVSLKGIEQTDASFPRESVISLAKAKRGELGIYLKDFAGKDLIDNWNYAAQAKEQPMIIEDGKDFRVIGPKLTDDTKELFDFIMKKGTVTTSVVAEKYKISSPNASMKLKKLLSMGLVLGSKETAESGGLEYVFMAIK